MNIIVLFLRALALAFCVCLCFVLKGDPDDNSLRKVEKEIIIPQRMRARAKELCASEVAGKTVATL